MFRKHLFTIGVIAAACIGLQGPVYAADQAMPSNMIFFVDGTNCPAGSFVATNAAGRMLLVTTYLGDVGKTYGTPLKDQEDRTHTHSGTMTVDLRSHHISGASGGGNGQGTSKGSHSASVTSGAGDSGLPFIQLLVCQVK
ncbi:MAG: hypothetical protein CVV05_10000 [Gammaproteobacteria bacterium HGW-Gammaproteobacteria-1]|jgi:hypothetical protein|nr:MAG: hypothetical protein CVV05_10000 [Gammaproteobacteria bacterium HGW-Gammaproteobacteria-1]